MSFSELLVIFLVALIVFGPSKLPMLARHLGLILRRLGDYKTLLTGAFQLLVDKELASQTLRENIKKANDADLNYQHDKNKTT